MTAAFAIAFVIGFTIGFASLVSWVVLRAKLKTEKAPAQQP